MIGPILCMCSVALCRLIFTHIAGCLSFIVCLCYAFIGLQSTRHTVNSTRVSSCLPVKTSQNQNVPKPKRPLVFSGKVTNNGNVHAVTSNTGWRYHKKIKAIFSLIECSTAEQVKLIFIYSVQKNVKNLYCVHYKIYLST